mmetsp:Transcript_25613/g.83740  ORF Transcript_25613/g.83740 Transcript_25613/m.83740 type:complete len:234 (-) Transcript_25613:824-1525(-)
MRRAALSEHISRRAPSAMRKHGPPLCRTAAPASVCADLESGCVEAARPVARGDGGAEGVLLGEAAARLATLLRGPLPARRRLGAVAVGVRPEDGAVVEEDRVAADVGPVRKVLLVRRQRGGVGSQVAVHLRPPVVRAARLVRLRAAVPRTVPDRRSNLRVAPLERKRAAAARAPSERLGEGAVDGVPARVGKDRQSELRDDPYARRRGARHVLVPEEAHLPVSAARARPAAVL